MTQHVSFPSVLFRPAAPFCLPAGLCAETLAAWLTQHSSADQVSFDLLGEHGASVWGEIADFGRDAITGQWVIQAWHGQPPQRNLSTVDSPVEVANENDLTAEWLPEILTEEPADNMSAGLAYHFRLMLTVLSRRVETPGFLPEAIHLPLPPDPNAERLERLQQALPALRQAAGRIEATLRLWAWVLACPVHWSLVTKLTEPIGPTLLAGAFLSGDFDDGLPAGEIQVGPVPSGLYPAFKPGGAALCTLRWLCGHTLPLDLNIQLKITFASLPQEGMVFHDAHGWYPADLYLPFSDDFEL